MQEPEKKQNLYELVVAAQDIVAELIKSGGELTPEIEARLETNELALAHKVDSYAYVEEQFEAQSQLLKAREEAIARVRRGIENARERLRSNLKGAMESLDRAEVSGAEFRYKLSIRQPKVVVVDEKSIPEEFKHRVISWELDKDALSAAVKEGREVPGARLEPVHALLKQVNIEGKRK